MACGTSYITEFFMCFAGSECKCEICYEKIEADGKSKDIYWARINEGKTLLVITPFFGGQYGLNTDALINKFGNKIGLLLDNRQQPPDR